MSICLFLVSINFNISIVLVETTTKIQLKVPAGQQTPVRLDKYITSFIENATRNKVQAAIKEGFVLVNGKPEKASYVMQAGDVIDIDLPKPPPPEAKAEAMNLEIVFEDEWIIIVNKPAGMVVHPAFGNWSGTLVNGLLHHTQDLASAEEETLRPGIVHRLDKDTSGLLVVAKDDSTLSKLSKDFAEKNIKREYRAIVWGNTPEEGTFDEFIGRSRRDRKLMSVLPEGTGKRAVTHFETLELFDYLSYVGVRLETGRTHQIRVHFAHHQFPVFGDVAYGGDSVRYGPNTGSRKTMFHKLITDLGRQCLHAATLGFIHPATGEWIEFESTLPDDFAHVLEMLRNNCKQAY